MGHTTSGVSKRPKGIWIDLDNTPHVPFFAPIIEELKKRGYSVLVTARECFQVCELANLLNLQCKVIGHHYGKHRIFKLSGLFIRTIQLAPTVLEDKADIAISHGSRSQLLLATLLGIPSIVIVDYEFTQGWSALHPRWVMVPDVISDDAIRAKSHIMRYPGIKEDVYVPRFKPDSSIMSDLDLNQDDLVITLRPPANEAHYHNPESEELLTAVLNSLQDREDAKVILLPRNHHQENAIRKSWPSLFDSGKMLVPANAVDGLNLIWHSDLVISGGGTMNREAAALGVPVYSIFRGRIGAVDRYLARTGRLVLVESVAEVRTKILLQRRQRPAEPTYWNNDTLMKIVDNVVSALEARHMQRNRAASNGHDVGVARISPSREGPK